MSTENTTPEKDTAQPSDTIEVSWEQIEKTYTQRQSLAQFERNVADFLLDLEKQKTQLISQLSKAETDLYNTAIELQSELGLSSEFTYELKMPSAAGEVGYFIRKES